MNRWFELAHEASEKSDYGRINIGAVILKGNYLISTGYNQKKSHPRQAYYNELYLPEDSDTSNYLHAEIHALIRSGREDLDGADIYIARKNRNDELANCRPCVVCLRALKSAGISRIYYTREDGYFYEDLGSNE